MSKEFFKKIKLKKYQQSKITAHLAVNKANNDFRTIMQVVVDKCMHFANQLNINHLRA